jgi:uncharacterized protein (DUF433 family)
VARNQKLMESSHVHCLHSFLAPPLKLRQFLCVWKSFLRGFLVVTLRRCLPTSLVFLFPGLRSQAMQFPELERITLNPMIMGGKPCIRGMRITVGTIVGLVASDALFEEIVKLYRYLESEDIRAAVAYAAWRSEEREMPLQIETRPSNALAVLLLREEALCRVQ